MEEEFVTCPECDQVFCVIWKLNYFSIDPQFCPFCGCEMNYEECLEE